MADISSKPALPSTRTILSSIFNSLSQTPLSIGETLPGHISTTDTPGHAKYNATSNPLKALTATRRALLITLHVLFPSLLLQALDLLDRKLVTRATQVMPSGQHQREIPRVQQPPQAHIQLAADSNRLSPQQDSKTRQNHFYLVLTAQSIHHHARSHSNNTASASRYTRDQSTRYIVRLEAWNCSCAAFAFSAFPGSASGTFIPEFADEAEEPPVPRDVLLDYPEALRTERNVSREGPGPGPGGDGEQEWSFGGLSTDGLPGGAEGVPCCKHLLACLLAERCEEELGGYVKEVRLGREEMAGLGADG
jgi:hypothetical protein